MRMTATTNPWLFPGDRRRRSPGTTGCSHAPLFYSFNLEDHVPTNHLLRGIDRFLDLSELHERF